MPQDLIKVRTTFHGLSVNQSGSLWRKPCFHQFILENWARFWKRLDHFYISLFKRNNGVCIWKSAYYNFHRILLPMFAAWYFPVYHCTRWVTHSPTLRKNTTILCGRFYNFSVSLLVQAKHRRHGAWFHKHKIKHIYVYIRVEVLSRTYLSVKSAQ